MAQTEVSDHNSTRPPSETLMRMLSGHHVTQAIFVAAKLGIADLLKDGAKSSEELAESINVDARSLYRLMRALSSIGIFAEVKYHYFAMTPLAEYLRTDIPDSMYAIAILEGKEWQWQSWGNLYNSIKTGVCAFEHKFGMTVSDYCKQNPEHGQNLHAALTRYAEMSNNAVLNNYDFSWALRLVDVGGGYGSLLANILRANPTMRGAVFDLPYVIEFAQQKNYFQLEELAGRYEFLRGDFFESVPSGGDIYILKQIIHNWDDDRARKILQNCYDAMPEHGKLLIIDPIILSDNYPTFSKFLDLQMLVTNSDAYIRNVDELEKLLYKTGFRLTKIIPTQSPCTLAEGVKS